MKKILTLFAVLCLNNLLQAQIELIETFQLSSTGLKYGIYADICASSDDFTVYVDWISPNGTQYVKSQMIGLKKSFDNNTREYKWSDKDSEVEKFITELEILKKKYETWTAIAKSHSLSLFSRLLSYTDFKNQVMYFSQEGNWYQEKGVDIDADFYVNRSGDCFLVLKTDPMTNKETVAQSLAIWFDSSDFLRTLSSASETVVLTHYCPGASLSFSSPAEIDDFIMKLRKVVEWKRENLEAGKLFE